LPRLERLTELDAEHFFPRDGVLRLAALLPDGGEAAHAAADALKLSNADRTRLEHAPSTRSGPGAAAHCSKTWSLKRATPIR